MIDTLAGGQKTRALNLVDDFIRECLAVEMDTSLSEERVARVLPRTAESRGLPDTIVCDNGSEFTSMAMLR